jgi:hypothetical protein
MMRDGFITIEGYTLLLENKEIFSKFGEWKK